MARIASFGFRFEFLPVGQGLFGYGKLSRFRKGANGDPRPSAFRWIYDCGTSSTPQLVAKAINAVVPAGAQKSILDMVVFSHFDRDHVSGAAELIGRVRIRRLFLPYMSLARRLLIAFADGVAMDDDRIALYVDPVNYFLSMDGADIDEIILVPATGSSPPPPDGPEGPERPEPPPSREPWHVVVETREPSDDEEKADLDSWQGLGVRVVLMRSGTRVEVANCWEFLPYNDAELASKPTNEFRQSVGLERQALLQTKSLQGRVDALARLRAIYDRTFGSRSESRNVISLFLYGGPLTGWRRGNARIEELWPEDCEVDWLSAANRTGILYTGDGYLDTKQRLDCLMSFLDEQNRLRQLAVFQVMHHGAERNWHKGVASRVSPEFSIFSSDPTFGNLRHPHAPVLRDFWRHQPVQVDGVKGFRIRGQMKLEK